MLFMIKYFPPTQFVKKTYAHAQTIYVVLYIVSLCITIRWHKNQLLIIFKTMQICYHLDTPTINKH
jgi:hypothetical protein